MIIPNGTISFHSDSGELDASGFPVAVPMNGLTVPCQIVPNQKNNIGRYDGETFTVAQYLVYIDGIMPCQAMQATLIGQKGDNRLRPIIATKYLRAINQTVITI